MTDQHPITPPPELVQQWAGMRPKNDAVQQNWIEIATQAARWAADIELDACCEWITEQPELWEWASSELRAARRPKPPSLKAQALAIVENLGCCDRLSPKQQAVLNRALEALPDD